MSSFQSSVHQQTSLEDDDRHNRFTTSPTTENGLGSIRERAASQPPRSSDQSFPSPSQQHFTPSSLSSNRSPWSSHRLVSPTRGVPQPMPIRSSSFSSQSQGQFSSAMRERAFPSTFEDDESEGLSDTYDEVYPSSLSRGRIHGQENSRSRSQSLATPVTRPGPVGSPYSGGVSAMQSWNESFLSNPLNIPGRFGEIKPPGSSRYGSLGTLGRSPSNIHSSSPSGGSVVGNGFSNRKNVDISNMSPFVRDVGQILLDDGSAFRELWAGMHPPRDENGGGGSGTTSRRHSVSVVQPRRGNIVGFNVPGNDLDEPSRSNFGGSFGGRGLLLSDDDLASDLGMLSLNPSEPSPSSSSQYPPSQPSSLPIYAPLSRSPPSKDLTSPYQGINLNIPNSFSRRLGTPSDGGLSAGGNSPSVSSNLDQHFAETYSSSSPVTRHQNQAQQSQQQQQTEFTARFIPGQGIQYVPTSQARDAHSQYTRNRTPSYSGNVPSPISPTGTRLINPQQQPYYPQLQRRPSDAAPSLSDLGKGVPLHSVPPSWPLFIVEFKAGRTDLFYLTELSLDVRVGDLVIVEADRGKDLGKVVNDSITIAEVEAFQKQQQERMGMGSDGGQPLSPGGPGSAGSGSTSKKEINPKMIYGKAQPQDTQLLISKHQDEVKALQLCQSKVRAKKLPMEVVDAEYQWDRRKLTFYFVAEKRIDFRELVRELFRLYKTRIWMASLQGGTNFEQ